MYNIMTIFSSQAIKDLPKIVFDISICLSIDTSTFHSVVYTCSRLCALLYSLVEPMIVVREHNDIHKFREQLTTLSWCTCTCIHVACMMYTFSWHFARPMHDTHTNALSTIHRSSCAALYFLVEVTVWLRHKDIHRCSKGLYYGLIGVLPTHTM